MAGAGLDDAVRSQGKRKPPDERGAGAEPDRPQPQKRESSGAEIAEQHEGVPGEDRARERVERPERQAERPAGEVDARLGLGPEAVGVVDRILAAGELMPGQPELPDRLQMVARSGRSGEPAQALCEERIVRVLQRRPGGDNPGAKVEGDDARYNARAAERNSSKSGSSASSKAHTRRTVPPASMRKAERRATSAIPR